MTWDGICAAVRDGCDNARDVAVYLGVDLGTLQPNLDKVVADGRLEYVDGCCDGVQHLDRCELRIPLVRVSGGAR